MSFRTAFVVALVLIGMTCVMSTSTWIFSIENAGSSALTTAVVDLDGPSTDINSGGSSGNSGKSTQLLVPMSAVTGDIEVSFNVMNPLHFCTLSFSGSLGAFNYNGSFCINVVSSLAIVKPTVDTASVVTFALTSNTVTATLSTGTLATLSSGDCVA